MKEQWYKLTDPTAWWFDDVNVEASFGWRCEKCKKSLPVGTWVYEREGEVYCSDRCMYDDMHLFDYWHKISRHLGATRTVAV